MYNSGSLRDRSIKIEVIWGLKARDPAIFLEFYLDGDKIRGNST
jgi:hypothetical protein